MLFILRATKKLYTILEVGIANYAETFLYILIIFGSVNQVDHIHSSLLKKEMEHAIVLIFK